MWTLPFGFLPFPLRNDYLLSSKFTVGGRLRKPTTSRCKMEMKNPSPQLCRSGSREGGAGEGGEGRVLQVRAWEGRRPPAQGPDRSPEASSVYRPRVLPRLCFSPGMNARTTFPEEL